MDARLGIDDGVGLKISGLWPADGCQRGISPLVKVLGVFGASNFTSRIGALLVW